VQPGPIWRSSVQLGGVLRGPAPSGVVTRTARSPLHCALGELTAREVVLVVADWNPDLYLRFRQERTQPVKDLISRIDKEHAERIIDIGCGPGNSTIELKRRWPDAHIMGLDSSEAMLEAARRDYPDLEWVHADASGDLSYLGKFDIVFSNAAIQWIPDHKRLLERLFNLVADGGVMAMQVPNTGSMPIGLAVLQTAGEARWQQHFSGVHTSLHYEDLSFYYDVLSPLAGEIHLWETHYNHVMSGHNAIIEWYKSTGMRPYLERLDETERAEFIQGVLSRVRVAYKAQQDGRVLFPFRRLFFVAYRRHAGDGQVCRRG
jgi:trans-aconitate 2-methyltransferase